MKTLFLLILISLTSGCLEKPETRMFNQAKKAYSEKNFKTATMLFEKLIKSSKNNEIKLKSAESLTSIYDINGEFKKKRKSLLFIVVNAKEKNQRIRAKQQMADMEFFKLKNYTTAIADYSELVLLGHDKIKNQVMISKSYYYLNNYDQALFEIKKILQETKEQEIVFETELLKSHIEFSKKNYLSASTIYKELIEKYPIPSKENFVLLNLAMSYEESGRYTDAIVALKELQSFYHSPEFLAAKIEHIQKKKNLMPGGRGRLRR